MINYALYESNGKYLVSGVAQDVLTDSEIPDGTNVYYGMVKIGVQYHDVEKNIPVDIPEMPEGFWLFDYDTKQWVGDTSQATLTVLYKREELLYKSDWTQLPNSPLTAEQRTAWEVYRQALRDVTDQEGYPLNVIWPTPPQ